MTRIEWILWFVVVPLLCGILLMQMVGCADKYPTKVDYVLTWPPLPLYNESGGFYVTRPVTYNVYEWPSLYRVGTTTNTSLPVRTPGCWFITATYEGGSEGLPNPVTCVPVRTQ